MSEEKLRDFCASFQEEALGQLVRKLDGASQQRPAARSILIAGGVAANQRFRALAQAKLKIPVYFPQLRFCSDNAAMIAALGYQHYVKANDKSVFRQLGWDAFSRYQFG